MTRSVEEIEYRVRWRTADPHPGAHRSRVAGTGDEFRGVVPLGEGGDARRIDLRASSRDPWGRPWVREHRQASRVPVVLLADLSSSMGFAGCADRLGLTGEFAAALARGAFRRGDPFGFVACDDQVRRELMQAPTLSRHAGEWVARRLGEWPTRGQAGAGDGSMNQRGAAGLRQAARWLPHRRSLVFLLSDLYLDPMLLGEVLDRLAHHDCIVVMLNDSAERRPPARWGLARLADLETGRERLVFLRPGMAERMAEHQARRIAQVDAIARRRGAALWLVEDRLDLQDLARQCLAQGHRALPSKAPGRASAQAARLPG